MGEGMRIGSWHTQVWPGSLPPRPPTGCFPCTETPLFLPFPPLSSPLSQPIAHFLQYLPALLTLPGSMLRPQPLFAAALPKWPAASSYLQWTACNKRMQTSVSACRASQSPARLGHAGILVSVLFNDFVSF